MLVEEEKEGGSARGHVPCTGSEEFRVPGVDAGRLGVPVRVRGDEYQLKGRLAGGLQALNDRADLRAGACSGAGPGGSRDEVGGDPPL